MSQGYFHRDWLCVAVCYSLLQCVTVCCSVLQSVAVCYSVIASRCLKGISIGIDCVLQCVTVCCSVVQSVAVCHSLTASRCLKGISIGIDCELQCGTVCCSVVQSVAVWYSLIPSRRFKAISLSMYPHPSLSLSVSCFFRKKGGGRKRTSRPNPLARSITCMCVCVHHVLFKWVSWLIHMFAVPQLRVWHYLSISVSRFIQICDMTNSYAWHPSFFDVCDVTHLYVGQDSDLAHVFNFRCCSITQCAAVYCGVLQYVAVCCSALQCVAVRCIVLPRVAVCCGVLQYVAVCCSVLQCAAVCCSVLQCVAVCCSVWQCTAACCSVWQCITGCHRVLQGVAGCCSVLQTSSLPASSGLSKYAYLHACTCINIHTCIYSVRERGTNACMYMHIPPKKKRDTRPFSGMGWLRLVGSLKW